MDNAAMARQMVEATKTAFDNSFNAMTLLQEQAEKMTESFLEQSPWLPKEGVKAVRDWIGMCRQGREAYKKSVDSGYAGMQELLTSGGK